MFNIEQELKNIEVLNPGETEFHQATREVLKSIQILFFRYTYQIEIPRGNISVAAQIKAISVGDLTHKARNRENILAPVVKGYEQLWRKPLYRLARADKRLAL